ASIHLGRGKIVVFVLTITAISVNGIVSIICGNLTRLRVMFCGIFIGVFTPSLVAGCKFLWEPSPFVTLLNMMFALKDSLSAENNNSALWKLGIKYCDHFSTLTAIVSSAFVIAVPLFKPEMPPFLGSLFPSSKNQQWTGLLAHLFLLGLQAWAIIIPTFIFCILVFKIFLGTLLCLGCSLSKFKW
ncbi:hypothetical protein Fcan01_15768, partial [Folsomia candida]